MTTCEGSCNPQRRASRVAAAIPISVAATVQAIAAGRIHAGADERRDASSHHSSTVTADAHVPGPGRRCPIPSNVLTAQAQSLGARCTAAAAAVLGSALIEYFRSRG